ncbi:MAG: alpha/beta hydrolase [Balneola sp.]|nr:MAG: alpha/beta hydrolase [Balneola sp.]
MIKHTLLFLLLLLVSTNSVAQDQEVIIDNCEIDIAGSYLAGDHENGYPLVIMISGSGAQDRDETVVGFKPFKDIADHLASQGISSFRFDDRQVGKSTGVFNDATLETLVSDVAAIIRFFQNDADTKYDEFILLGHSQGGMVGARTAAQMEEVKGLILMAAPTVPLKDVIDDQITIIQTMMGKTEADIAPTLKFQKIAYEASRTNEGWEEVKEAFRELLRTEIDKLPEAQRAFITDFDAFADAQYAQQIGAIQTPQMRTLLHYDAGEDIAKLDIPIFGIFGELDTQVTPSLNATTLESICEGNDLNCTMETISEANHLFQKAKNGMVQEYAYLEKKFIDGFLESLSNWVGEHYQ